jgi:hypothetical protein
MQRFDGGGRELALDICELGLGIEQRNERLGPFGKN